MSGENPDKLPIAQQPSPEVLSMARQAVEKLGIKDFLDEYKTPIDRKLLDCEKQASDTPVNGDMMFVAAALPIINGVIQIASDRSTMRRAMDWVQEQVWGRDEEGQKRDFDPVSVLSALTLIEVVNQAYRDAQKPDGRNRAARAEWNRIMGRMRKLSEEMDPEAATPED